MRKIQFTFLEKYVLIALKKAEGFQL